MGMKSDDMLPVWHRIHFTVRRSQKNILMLELQIIGVYLNKTIVLLIDESLSLDCLLEHSLFLLLPCDDLLLLCVLCQCKYQTTLCFWLLVEHLTLCPEKLWGSFFIIFSQLIDKKKKIRKVNRRLIKWKKFVIFQTYFLLTWDFNFLFVFIMF